MVATECATHGNNRDDGSSKDIVEGKRKELPLGSTKRRIPTSLWKTDTVTQIDCNIDDATGEQLAFAIEVLMSPHTQEQIGTSVVDAWITPIIMKKGRPGHTLSCLVREEESTRGRKKHRRIQDDGDDEGMKGDGDDQNHDQDDDPLNAVLDLIFRHTTTIGVRIRRGIERAKLHREIVHVPVSVPIAASGPSPSSSTKKPSGENNNRSITGTVGVKICKYTNDEVLNAKAEFDDCRSLSIQTGTPVSIIAQAAVRGISNTTSLQR